MSSAERPGMKHQILSTTPEISKRMANVHLKAGKEEIARERLGVQKKAAEI